MLNFPGSVGMPPTGENWFGPNHVRPAGPGGTEAPMTSVSTPPAHPNFSPSSASSVPPAQFPTGLPPPPPIIPPPLQLPPPPVVVDPAFFANLPPPPYHPQAPMLPLVPPPLTTPPPSIPPPAVDPHKSNEAEALKFISENEKALKGNSCSSSSRSSRDYKAGNNRDRGRETISTNRRRESREDSRRTTRSRSRSRYHRSPSRDSSRSSRIRDRSRPRSQSYSTKGHSSRRLSRDRGREVKKSSSPHNRPSSSTPRPSSSTPRPTSGSTPRTSSSTPRPSSSKRRSPPSRRSPPARRSSPVRRSSPTRRSPPDNRSSSRSFAQQHKVPDTPAVPSEELDRKNLRGLMDCSISKRPQNGEDSRNLRKGRLGGVPESLRLPAPRGRGGVGCYNKKGNFRPPRPQGPASSSNDRRHEDKAKGAGGGGGVLIEKKIESSDEDDMIEEWVRSSPSELYYSRAPNGDMVATDRARQLCNKFHMRLVKEAKEKRVEAEQEGVTHMMKLMEEEKKENELRKCQKDQQKKSCKKNDSSSDSDDDEDDEDDSGSDDSDSEELSSRSDTSNRELERRKKHPRRLHAELWHNEPGQMNDGPVCRCSAKARRFGIRHGFYPGEIPRRICDPFSNNSNTLFHYKILINPATNLVIRSPTVISHDGHEYIFEGFSIFSHYKLDEKLPPCRVIRFNIRYCMAVTSETFPQNFCVQELKLFETYIFREILELVDLSYPNEEDEDGGICSQFHLMPRFARKLPENGKELLSMDKVLQHLIKSDKELIEEGDLKKYLSVDQSVWQDFADKHKGTIVVKRGMKPCAIRVDQIDRNVECQESGQAEEEQGIPFPLIVHFGIRPPQLSYAGNVEYQRAWRRFVKYRHLLSNMPKPKIEDKRKLLEKDLKLQEMRTRSTMKRDVTVDISAKGFRTTGICCDLVQHAMLIPVLFAHMRFHKSLDELEKQMNYEFKNRYLLQLAMTHPSYRENFGTNPDHARNALTNCGIRQPEYGDRSIHYASSRKRGINTLIDIMARFGMKYETESEITHNERLEFLGDAVVEFVTSIHLFHIFPDLEEGGLATYRAAIVQNQHLAVLAQNLGLDKFMLYAHGSDLCHDSELRHAMANCFEALMGALFLDDGVEVWTQVRTADDVFAKTMYGNDDQVYDIWANYPRHPLQTEEPNGDRHWIKSHVALQKLAKFEEDTGIEFNHIRLLARAFTDRSLGYNNLSRGSNQRLEFLGDTVLQLIASEYLYRHFPDHHEGHLSLLRSSLVNNRTQSVVCDVLGMSQYAMRHDPKLEMKTKDRADLLEAFLGALYIDQGLEACVVFCSVCFFPRLTESIINQDWNDPKSKLQQCCLTLRSMDGKEPEIPTYKVTEVMGPTNTRVYKVAVYFKNKRLATSRGHSIQEAEMNAASNALVKRDYLFPQLKHQKRLLEKTTKKISQSQFFDFKP